MNKNRLLTSLTLLALLTLLTLSGTSAFGHDPVAVYPSPSTANYQGAWIIFPHFAVGTIGNMNYRSIILVTNTNREKWRDIKLTIYGTGGTRFEADYTVNGLDYSKYQVVNASIPPMSTTMGVFESDGPLTAGFIRLDPVGSARKDEISTSFFFQLRNVDTGELIDSVGVAPSDFGWHFVIPLLVSDERGINTGIAYSHIPNSQRIQIIFELRNAAGEQVALAQDTIFYPASMGVRPYHKALFVTEIFADFFADVGQEVDVFGNRQELFGGSLHIYAQRNINVLALRMDTRHDGDIQLTSVPNSGELCIDGPNRLDNCFQEETNLDLGWVPVRKKSKNELWADAGGVCDEAGVCSP